MDANLFIFTTSRINSRVDSKAAPQHKFFIKTLSLLLWSLSVFVAHVEAGDRCTDYIGRFTSVEGQVEVESESGENLVVTQIGYSLCEADLVKVGNNSRAAIQLINNSVLRLDQNTTLRLINVTDDNEQWAWIDLGKGTIHAFSRASWKVKVKTSYLLGLIKGTEFVVHAEPKQSELAVLEGQVFVENKQGHVEVNPGQKAVACSDSAPALQTVIRPRDAVQWTLYYPPILSANDSNVADTSKANPKLKRIMELAEMGDTTNALSQLNQFNQNDRGESYYTYRAALLLSLGRITESRAAIAQALQLNSQSSLAYALGAVMEVVQNHQEKALIFAEKGVAIRHSAASALALSYAQQANSKLEEARKTIIQATHEFADNSLVWARLGELQLMLGDRRQAKISANRAVSIAPNVAKSQIVLGFSSLAEYHIDAAKAAFEKAITASSADPMAHLGLGLAKIAEGDLTQGRQAIEAAVALDSNNALLRSYLGKAYFTEKRTSLDATQYDLAKSLDPLDPTAYLYDGIRKQSENRPIEALHDLQKSKELNVSRSVYRGRLLLDQDRAARGISLARVNKDLGFLLLGQREASLSLEDDPANPSAHRFLSDTYQGIRRREIARVSELLQAQLLQDININPIQPSLAETNLNIFTQGGPSVPGFNEFTPLYERNMAKLDVNGFGGNHNTFGGEGAVTALYNRFSFGAAGLHYQSDGLRKNNSLNQHLYNFFAQAAITPEINVQAEYRHRESQEGDLAFNFDPEAFSRDKSKYRSQDMSRFGLRYSPNQRTNILFSYIHTDLKQSGSDGSQQIDSTTIASSHGTSKQQGDQFEGQYLFEHEQFNVVAGFAHSDAQQADKTTLTFDDSASPPPQTELIASSNATTATRGYLYSHIKIPHSVLWTLGFSYDDFKNGTFTKSSFNPKFGLQWDITQKLRFRAAWLRALKPALINNRTIEPTQVAGFNQLFDDINGTLTTRYGAGFDWQITPNFFAGGEISWRRVEEPISIDSRNIIKNQHEDYHSIYLYWTPFDRLAIKAEFNYDLYRSRKGADTESGGFPPLAVETFSSPLSVSYFDSSGWFARLGGTFVYQKLQLDVKAPKKQGHDSFFLVDADIGYRLPKRYGIVSFGVKNLFNTSFNYQDDSYREFKEDPASTGPYFPNRILMGRVVLNY